MTDTDKLKRLAEFHCEVGGKIAYDAEEVATPILALIAENERLSSALKTANDGFEKHERLWYLAKDERDEAVSLLREWGRVGIDPTGGDSLDENTEDFLARIDDKETK